MVGIVIIALLFTGLSIAVAYGASKGSFKGVGDALQGTGRTGSRIFNASLVFVYLGIGIALPLIFILGNRANSNAQVAGIKLTASMQVGRELFAEHCGVCHTLAADNAVGKIGPNLDRLKPSEALILHTLANGCLQNAPTSAANSCRGFGTMPADIVEGRQAQDIAQFVSKVAGHP